MKKFLISGDRLTLAIRFIRFLSAAETHFVRADRQVPPSDNPHGFSVERAVELICQYWWLERPSLGSRPNLRECPVLVNNDLYAHGFFQLADLVEANETLMRNAEEVDATPIFRSLERIHGASARNPVDFQRILQDFASDKLTEADLREPAPATT